MAKKTMAELLAAHEQKNTGGGGGGDQSWKLFFPFWKAPIDSTSVVRFLPDLNEDNPLVFLTENLTHELVINGKKEKVPCLKMYGEDCPICALSQKYYDEKDPEHNEALGKRYYRKKGYIGQVLIVETPIAPAEGDTQLVKLIEFGPKIYNQIMAAFKSGDLEVPPYELKGGYNFRIKKTKSGEYADYGTSSFAPKQVDVADDLIAKLELYDLAKYRSARISRAQLEAMLIADQTGTSLAPAPAPAPASAPAAAPAQQESTAPAPAPAAGLSIMEQIRARQAAMAAAQAE